MIDVPAMFGCMVFNDNVMSQRLPKETYKALKKCIALGQHLDLDVANVVAAAMKDWAVEKGATHYTHWFQPLTGITAEKHDSFIKPQKDGNVIMSFSGKSLVKGEPDASSFPSGGLRATFEARGYTAWDPSSYAFIKNGVLCIPTAFCSYSGEVLDKKTPLLKSIDALSDQAVRILKLFGKNDVKRVIPQVGPEQEYFLIDKDMYLKRPDLIFCGRTLFGARPPKGQEMDDHYFGSLKARVSAYMKDLDEELWKLGVLAKTKHNEVAPAQHELAPVYSTANTATDHNQLTMEMMKTVANRHGLACLLHEKPFAGVNGSGKHDNWSLSTDTGISLLEPGATPHDNAQFLLFLCAVIKAVDDYQDLLRLSVAGPGNDHRLGGHEAPPAIVSIFLGDELTEILEALETDSSYVDREKLQMEIGATVLPHFPQDTTDRNRTSPFAFTNNKFEFRMLGSSSSVATPNTVINTIVAEVLSEFAERLENIGPDKSFDKELDKLIRETIKNHKRIIFNGNGYDSSWPIEAERRGLLNLKNTPDVLQAFISEKNIELFEKHKVLSRAEMFSRYDIWLENYSKTINIEALTMIDMVNKEIIPSALSYQNELTDLLAKKKALGIENVSTERNLIEKISSLSDCVSSNLEELTKETNEVKSIENVLENALAYRDKVLATMTELRTYVDELELIVSKKHWKLPTYADMLYSVNE